MKRFLMLASLMVFVAASCTKTNIKNEVESPISFSAESGKLTRAIVQGGTYPLDQPFGVYAYGKQANETTPVMSNKEVSYSTTDTKWSATGDVKYYWPNDPTTTMDFYAYSPFIGNDKTATAPDKVMNGTIEHTEAAGLSLSGYTHSNMYVDFMVATPVKGAKYSTPNGDQNATSVTSGQVPLSFHHQMTQVIFNVTTDKAYTGITFQIQKITLKGINNTASYVQDYQDAYGAWTATGAAEYEIFPAEATNGGVAEDEEAKKLTNAANAQTFATLTTTGVTMIPQTIEDGAQKFEIVYKISGTGVATETVTKEVEFFVDANTTVQWQPNKKITYTVKIGLNEITFAPSVVAWDENTSGSEYTFQQ